MSYKYLKEIIQNAEENNIEFWQVIMSEDMRERNVSEDDSFKSMKKIYEAMVLADAGYNPKLRSASGLAGGEGARLERYNKYSSKLVGEFLAGVMEKAVKMAESNACMKRIVAAPTAGSCGVIPAILLTYKEHFGASSADMIKALFVSAGIGEVLASSASISGAEGGCQAEIGSASAMAAGALVWLEGGTNEQIINAAALALKNMLGLVCDPVAGLVEVPCIKRNASGAVNAAVAAHMSLAGIKSKIPPDEVIEAMWNIGNQMPGCLKETGQGGLAVTPTGQEIGSRINF